MISYKLEINIVFLFRIQGILSLLGCKIKTVKIPGKSHCLEAKLSLPLKLPEKRSPLKHRRKSRR